MELFSDWPKAYSEFSKSVPVASSSHKQLRDEVFVNQRQSRGYYTQNEKKGSHVFASSLTASKIDMITALEIMHRGHT